MKLCMAGIDHVSAALEQREKLSLVRGQVQAVLLRIAERTGCAAVLLATCSRTELYLHAEGERVLPDAAEVLCEAAGAPACRPFLVQRTGGEAVRHLMQVSAGMQSQIFGDDQIVSQVKDAAALARELKTTDAVLDTLFRRAITAGKRVRTETRLTGVPASAAQAGVRRAERFFGTLAGNRAYEAERADTAWKQKMQEQLRQDEACLGGQAERCLQIALRADGAYLTAPFLACHPAVQGRALREAARRAGMPMRDLAQTHIEALERLLSSADPSARLDLPHGFTARREYEAFRIAPRARGVQPEALPLTVPFDGLWTDRTRVKLRKLEKSEVFYKTVNTFCADCGTIDFASLCVRARQTGDRLRLTEKGGSRTLKKLMIDRKIPAAERDALAVIADRSGVIAVQDIGMDLSRRPGNGARLEIKIERN